MMGREYINMEETAMRQEVWSDNLKLIHEHNKLDKSYTLAMNHLGDLVSYHMFSWSNHYQKAYFK